MKRWFSGLWLLLLLTSVASAQGPPPPRPSPPGGAPSPGAPSPGTVWIKPGAPIPPRQWVERLNGAKGAPGPQCDPSTVWVAESCGLGPGKHTRVFYHPGLKGLIVAGGDHAVGMSFPGPYDGTGSEILLYQSDIEKWTTVRPLCVPGEPQPGRPDNVIWAFDAKRNRAIMAEGYYVMRQWQNQPGFGPPGNVSGCGAQDGLGAYAFDFNTRKYIGPNDPSIVSVPSGGWPGDNGDTFGVVDPVNDELL